MTCDEEEILQALRIIAQEENMLVEGAAALAMAAYLKMTDCHTSKNNVVYSAVATSTGLGRCRAGQYEKQRLMDDFRIGQN